MMYDTQKSDSGVVPTKAANQGARVPAESLEGRAGIERNPGVGRTDRTQRREVVSQGAERIRQLVTRNPQEKLTALLHHVSEEALGEAYAGLRPEAAPGVDGMTWDAYGVGLDERLSDLHRRVHVGAYRATPSRRVMIPKPDGGERPLGIAALEDKIVQKAVVDGILTPIYEAEFLGFSYGFRPGRSAHDALDALAVGIERCKVNWILDADVARYFDTLDRDRLVDLLGRRIGDRRLLRLIRKWLNAGVLEEGLWADTGRGTPQGAVISPVLANVYLHYVLDAWVRQWRQEQARGEVIIVRYADDFVLGFQHRGDAVRLREALEARLADNGLALHPEKTRLIEFGRFAAASRAGRGEGKPKTFDFLGFTHYCGKTRQGRFQLGRKPIAKRMSRKLKGLKRLLLRNRHADPKDTARWLGQVLNGWLNYYAVPGSYRFLARFRERLKRIWARTLRRRSQKGRIDWKKLDALCKELWPAVRIRHPWPNQRFAVRYTR